MSEWIKKLAGAYSKVNEKTLTSKEIARAAAKGAALAKPKDQVSVKKAPWDEAMDPVDKSELKGKHKDRKDKDIDNDGDVDSSDEYLHKRRKAISKKHKKDETSEVEMNPKKEKADTNMAVESTVYARILEARKMKATADKGGEHTKSATDQEEIDDNSKSSKGAMDMLNTPRQTIDNPEASGDEVKKAADAAPKAKARSGDNKAGDKKIIPSAT